MRALLPLLALLAGCGSSDPRDGRWQAETINGRDVSAGGYSVTLKGGRVTSGRDGCNAWGRSEQPGIIVADASECPPDSNSAAYRAIADAEPFPGTVRADGRLYVAWRGHAAIFRRMPD